MKKILLSLPLLFLSVLVISQNNLYETELELNVDGLIEYSEVVQAEGKTANELYSQAREWFVDTYNSANDVLQMEDKANW